MTKRPSRRQATTFLAAAVGGLIGGPRGVVAAQSHRGFTPPPEAEYDLLYYLPGDVGPLHAARRTPSRGPVPQISGSEYKNVEERANVLLGSDTWGDGTAYVFFQFDVIPAEIICYFRSPPGVVAFPTMGIASDFTGSAPFWHLQLNSNIRGFIPEFSYNKPPLVSTGMQWTTQTHLEPGDIDGWLVYRVQQSQHEARLTVESASGTLLAECYCLSANLPRHLGRNVFFELLGREADSFVFGFLGAKSSIRQERSSWIQTGLLAAASMATFPGSGMWRSHPNDSDPLAGTATYLPEAQAWELKGEAPWGGGVVSVGNLKAGDVVDFWGSCLALEIQGGTTGAVVALLSDGGSNPKESLLINAVGVFHFTIEINSDCDNAKLFIGCGESGGYVRTSLRDLLITRNKIWLTFAASNP